MGQSELSDGSGAVQVVELAAAQIKSQTTVWLLLKVQLGRQGQVYLTKQERVIDIHLQGRRQKEVLSCRVRKLPSADSSEGACGICSSEGFFLLLLFFLIILLLCTD